MLRIEGGMALAFTVTAKAVPDESSKGSDSTEDEELPPEDTAPPQDAIEVGEDDDDPLGGI